MAELKNNILRECPFCGGEAELNYYGSESMPFYSVSCKECGCNQDSSIHKEAVIEAWNKRVNKFDADKYEKLIFADMERKKMENEQILDDMRKILLTGETAKEIREKAIDEFSKKAKELFSERNVTVFEWNKLVDDIAEQLKEE